MIKMSNTGKLSAVALVLVFVLAPRLAWGQDEEYRLMLDWGYRGKSDVAGSEDLYRSQLDYGEGPKLFAGRFFVAPSNGPSRFFDRLELRMNSWGGEPYNTAHLRASKDGLYDLEFDYRNVHYFNALPFFSNPLFESGNLQAQHKFDISQRFARIHLTFRPEERFSPFVAYERTSRQGPVRTSLAADGDEFVVDADTDIHSDDLRVGFDLKFSRLSVLLEQGFRWYRDETPFRTLGFQEGNSSRPLISEDITLARYEAQSDVTVHIPFSNAVVVYQPTDSLLLRGDLSYNIADLSSNFSDQLSGNFLAFSPIAVLYPDGGKQAVSDAKSPNLSGSFSAHWQPLARLRIVERFDVRRFHVAGSSLVTSTFLDAEPLLGSGVVDRLDVSTQYHNFFSVDLNIQEVQGFFYPTPGLLLRLGHRYESKEFKADQTFRWNRNVLIAGAAYDFSSSDRISVEYELGRTDQAILRSDPVHFERLRLRGRWSVFEPLHLRGSISLFDHDNQENAIDFTSRSRNYSLQFTYAPGQRVSISGEYQRSDVDTDILFTVPQLLVTDRLIYRERGDYANLFLSFLLFGKTTLSLGYSVWGTVGNFPITDHRPLAKVEIPVKERWVVYGQWNYYDHNEKFSLFPQDFRTHLGLIGLRMTLD